MVKNSMNKMVKLIFSCVLVSTFVLIDQAFARFCDNPKGSVDVCIGKKCKKMPSASICQKKSFIYFDDGENVTQQIGRPTKPRVLPTKPGILKPSAVAAQPVMPTTGQPGVPGMPPSQPGVPGMPPSQPGVQGIPQSQLGVQGMPQSQPGVQGMPQQVQGQPGSGGDCSIKTAQYCVGKRCQTVQVQANGDTQEIVLPRSTAKGSRKVILGDAPSGNGLAPQIGGRAPQGITASQMAPAPQGGLVPPQGITASQMAPAPQGGIVSPPQQGTSVTQSAPVQQGGAGVGAVACVPGQYQIQYCAGPNCKMIKNKCNGNLITFDPIDSSASMMQKIKKTRKQKIR
jgi:hypothetical protein